MEILGIDIGGSGIKGAPVDIAKGKLTRERYRIPTPQPATPQAVSNTVAAIARHFNWKGVIGCGFPAALQDGVALTATNIDKSWIGTNASEMISKASGCPTIVRNDADVAGLAEVKFGAGKGQKGVVFMITIGTGLGSAVFTDGNLLYNTELGHIPFHGMVAEQYAADSVRKRENLNLEEWAKRFNEYLHLLEKLFYPNLFILGGGKSKKFDEYSYLFDVRARVVPAQMQNNAGIVGAAMTAESLLK